MIQLHDKESLGSITTPWMPNACRGTRNESRVTMTLSVSDSVREAFELIEERVRDLMRTAFPKIEPIGHSATKPGDRHKATLRAKINVSGDKIVRYVDVDGNTIEPPTQWHNR